ncbi:MAG: response regulator [Candidatus Omnitrophica bacterium]|nr:response regulator [Candidatus Omnitrophota bacterium]
MALKILLIEDDHDITATTQSLLEKKGYAVRTALCAEDALKIVRQDPPEMIITDYRLPGQNGDALTHDIKSTPATSHIPVLMCTAQTSLAQPLGGNPHLHRPDAYLIKPFSSSDLLAKIRALTGG